MEREPKHNRGRFFKKDNILLANLKLSPFNLKEIVRSSVVTYDNMAGNIITADLHSPNDLSSGVKNHRTMNSELRDSSQIRPLLVPLDFTQDWERQRDRVSKGVSGRIEDDEDAFELEIEFQRTKEVNTARNVSTAKTFSGSNASELRVEDLKADPDDENSSAFEGRIKDAIATLPDSDLHTATPSAEEEREIPNHYRAQHDKLDELGKVIIDFAEHQEPDENAGVHLKKSSAKTSVPNQTPGPEVNNPPHREDFIPMGHTKPGQNETDGPGPEQAAIEDYHRRVDETSSNPEEANRIYEEAKHRGYEDGFAIGEQKASIQGVESTKEVIQKLELMATKFRNLQREALLKSTDNFKEITQAIAESILRKELAFDPSVLARLFQSAVEESVPSDDFVLHVAPRDYEELQGLSGFELKKKLKSDESIEAGDFRIETKMATIDGRLSKTIAELIERLDLEPSISAVSKAS